MLFYYCLSYLYSIIIARKVLSNYTLYRLYNFNIIRNKNSISILDIDIINIFRAILVRIENYNIRIF